MQNYIVDLFLSQPSLVLGDVAGHAFHGNQYTASAETASSEANAKTRALNGAMGAKNHADMAQAKADEAKGHLAKGKFGKAVVAYRSAAKYHKKAWLEHEDTYNHVDYRDVTRDGEAASAQMKAKAANEAAAKSIEADHPEAKSKPRRVSAREQANLDAGLKKVRGDLGGVYYE